MIILTYKTKIESLYGDDIWMEYTKLFPYKDDVWSFIESNPGVVVVGMWE